MPSASGALNALHLVMRTNKSFDICLSHIFLCGVLTLPCSPAYTQTTPAPLNLRVSSEIAPAGSSVQFKLRADSPVPIASGAFTIDLDPTVFGAITDVTVFSATGDVLGYADVAGRHAEVHFSSPSGSIGQLPGLPIAVLTAAVNVGATVPVTIDPTQVPWLDTNGKAYTITTAPGALRSGVTLWLQSVTPGGGYLPAGTVLRLSGGGFDATTKVAVDGVSVAAQQLVDPQHIELTLGGATEMTGEASDRHQWQRRPPGTLRRYPQFPVRERLPISGRIPHRSVEPVAEDHGQQHHSFQ